MLHYLCKCGDVMDIPNNYSCVTNTLTPAVTKQISTATMQMPAATTQKPTTKLLSAINIQTSTAIEKMHTATVQEPTTLASLN
ncbi:hypothetical protein DSO57_1007392 [Entomophthora muscae]|uniref:Uncharacterized protein n=1 Tax=Entomophthora muscae TaxID=34485 RepID=A0ACC2TUB4_9FUNG|nr:hypothetical protein DSO57_1007392 [Entomophthora muscae]